MTDKIIELLKNSGADAWEVTDKCTEGWEFYFIKHQLDQNRVRDVEHIEVTVHRKLEDGKLLGSASQEIAPTASEAEAKKIIDNLFERASYVKNPYYELNKKTVESDIKSFDPEQMARDFIEAMQQVPETSGEDINSYEIFAESCKRRYVNSEGIDVTVCYPSSTVEVVVNARNEEHEIELYRLYTAGTCDKENLVKEISNTLKYGKDRLVAQPTPSVGKAAVLFPTQDSTQIFKWFAIKMNAAMKYRGISNFEIGKPVVEGAVGDTITITAVKELPNSSKNTPVDSEGAQVRDMDIIRENVPVSFWGDAQFRYYLGVDAFIASNFKAEGGKLTESEIRTGTYLEPVEFSDFSVDMVTGDIAGEIRLAYWHDGEKVTPVTGGSVSGNLAELVKNIKLSKELRQYDTCLIPSVTKLEGVTVTGA
jgi:PmbA protein